MFEIKFSKQAEKFLSRCKDELFNRIKKKVNALKINPVPSEAKRLKSYERPTFRIRVGKYRVLYEIRQIENWIVIVKIDKRERVY
ncbi:MAG: type II toxin-antitoxin system RelE/ParE family toxin [Candidatus Woesearchaeota archaeon]